MIQLYSVPVLLLRNENILFLVEKTYMSENFHKKEQDWLEYQISISKRVCFAFTGLLNFAKRDLEMQQEIAVERKIFSLTNLQNCCPFQRPLHHNLTRLQLSDSQSVTWIWKSFLVLVSCQVIQIWNVKSFFLQLSLFW